MAGLARRSAQNRRVQMNHAFIDESRRANRYLLTAAIIDSTKLQAITQAIRKARPRGNQRTHFSAERPNARRAILDAYTRLDLEVQLAMAEYAGGDDQAARDACLRRFLEYFSRWRVGVVIFDTRGEERDRLDRSLIEQAKREKAAPPELRYTHRGSRNEPLLWVPDAVGWAWGAGKDWRRRVDRLVRSVLEVS